MQNVSHIGKYISNNKQLTYLESKIPCTISQYTLNIVLVINETKYWAINQQTKFKSILYNGKNHGKMSGKNLYFPQNVLKMTIFCCKTEKIMFPFWPKRLILRTFRKIPIFPKHFPQFISYQPHHRKSFVGVRLQMRWKRNPLQLSLDSI